MTSTELTAVYCLSDVLRFTRHFFLNQHDRKFLVGRHHELICQKLNDVVSGKTKRLIINIAPRYGKTELAVKAFIAYGLALNPRANFLHLSYSSSLAEDNSVAVKRIVESDEYRRLFPGTVIGDKNTQCYWNTTKAGGLYATSTLGQITGFGAGLTQYEGVKQKFGGAVIIDDPIKPEDALIDNAREAVNRRFETTIRSRVNSRDTPIVIIMQRLHEHDLCGYLKEVEPDQWEALSLPCIDYSGGAPVALWEDKHTLAELEKIRAVNTFVFDTQYMQDPKPIEGLMYEQGFRTYPFVPVREGTIKAYIDTADTGADYLCCIVYKECDTGNYVLDVLYTQKPMEYTEVATAQMLSRHKVEVAIIESNNGGRGFGRNVEANARRLGNNRTSFRMIAQTQHKETRIFTHSADVQNLCFFPVGWERTFREFHDSLVSYMKVGRNAHDDAPDALTGTVEYRRKNSDNSLAYLIG